METSEFRPTLTTLIKRNANYSKDNYDPDMSIRCFGILAGSELNARANMILDKDYIPST